MNRGFGERVLSGLKYGLEIEPSSICKCCYEELCEEKLHVRFCEDFAL